MQVLLDTNMLIGAFESEPGNAAHQAANERLNDLLSDPEVELVITSLIRYEVLRGVRRIPCSEMSAILNDFKEFVIRKEEANRAAELFCLAKDNGMVLDKRSFDLFHCVCAEIHDLEMASQDAGIRQIQQLIQESTQNA
jgi:predicted nucleic acid-binding protein